MGIFGGRVEHRGGEAWIPDARTEVVLAKLEVAVGRFHERASKVEQAIRKAELERPERRTFRGDR